MFKVDDEVLVKGIIVEIEDDEHDACPISVGFDRCRAEWFGEEELIPVEKTYTQGLADAWELAKKILFKEYGYSAQQIYDIFGDGAMQSVKNLTYEEALAKIEAYEKEKEIKVGDVVSFEDETKALVVDEALENAVFVFTENGCIEKWDRTLFKKTGKHIDIESLLRQIGE